MHKYVLLAVLCVFGCGGSDDASNEFSGTPQKTSLQEVDVSGPIVKDTVWDADHVYYLRTHIFVSGAVLTIQEGTKIVGDVGSSLVVTPSAKIKAMGTAQRPVVFTSAQPEGARMPGDWGGIVLLGKAPINVSGGVSKVEGFPDAQGMTSFGGNDPKHDCGVLQYVRIEFAGFELAPDNELNALTVAGCGSDTRIDYVQAHMGADDGVEIFGGTVNIKHIAVTQPDDDGLDWDFGWTGKAQYLVVQQNKVVGNMGIEADNNKNNNDATPRSHPVLSHVTLIGSGAATQAAGKLQGGVHLRRGTAAEITHMIVLDFADLYVDVDGASTVAQSPEHLFVKNSVFYSNQHRYWTETADNDNGFSEESYFSDVALNNRIDQDPLLQKPHDLSNPVFLPSVESFVLGVEFPQTLKNDGFWDTSAKHIGAFGVDDWSSLWTSYPRD